MKISLTSRGGWTAPLRRPPLTLDTDALPPEAAAEVERLAAAAEGVAAAPALESAADAGPARHAPEAMRHTITIERDGRQVTLTASDLDEAPELTALREWIEAQAVRSRTRET